MRYAWVLLLAGMLVQVGMGKTKCVTTRGADGIETRCIGWDAPKPEALDVPAIVDPTAVEVCSKAPSSWISRKDCMDANGWTCDKGSGRILLEDVDGGHHCVKFPKGEK